MTELVQTGAEKFRAFQAHRRETELERRSVSTNDNWFWLMDQIKSGKEGKSVDYRVQSTDCSVRVSYVSGYLEDGSYSEQRYLGITQPTGIDNHVISTVFCAASLNHQKPQCIVFTTEIYDKANPSKVISHKDEETQLVSFGIRGHIPNLLHNLGDEDCLLVPLAEEAKIAGESNNHYLSYEEVDEIIDNAYKAAFSAVTRGIVPETTQPASPTLLQRPFELQLL